MRFLSLVFLILILSHCASNKVAQMEAIEQVAFKAAAKAELSPAEAIAEGIKKLALAEQENLSFYSPGYLHHAQKTQLKAIC